jgi:hypothetical protein
VQEMLKWGNPFLWGVLAPLFLLIILALIPYILPKPANHEWGSWFPKSNRLAQAVLALIAFLILLLTLLAFLATR